MKNKNESGSILIIFLWILVVLGLFSLSVAVRTRLAVKLEGADTKRFQRNSDYFSAVNLARFFIEQDGDPASDGLEDKWRGVPAEFLKMDFSKRFKITISDEESKININTASGDLLRNFFTILRKNGVSLQTDPEDLAASILAWRGGGAAFGKSTVGFKHKRAPFESLEELSMIQYVHPEDVRLIMPYLTVYGTDMTQTFRVNINTAHPYILEALVESLNPGAFAGKTLLTRIELFRNYRGVKGRPQQAFQTMDLDLSGFLTRLDVLPSIEMTNLINMLLRYVVVDSRVFNVDVDYKVPGAENYRMEAVLGARSGFQISPASFLEVLAWHEGVAL